MDSDVKIQRSMEHAWRYFELHAQQRMTVFNFYLAISGLIAAGIGICLQQGVGFSALISMLGVALSLVSFLFWKLDQRVTKMIKKSEIALRVIEKESIISVAALFSNDSDSNASCGLFSVWSYGRCFRVAFMTVGLIGAAFTVLPHFTSLSS